MKLLWYPQHMGLQKVALLRLVKPSYFGGGGAYYGTPAVVKEWDVGVEELPRKGAVSSMDLCYKGLVGF